MRSSYAAVRIPSIGRSVSIVIDFYSKDSAFGSVRRAIAGLEDAQINHELERRRRHLRDAHMMAPNSRAFTATAERTDARAIARSPTGVPQSRCSTDAFRISVPGSISTKPIPHSTGPSAP